MAMPTASIQASAVLLTDQLEKPSLDTRSYRLIQLRNKLEALLVHDPKTDKASAALDVKVGSFSDEDSMPGMAHAVEHLLFMGTKKFPVENEYSQYMSNNSGSSNAHTVSTSTKYYFELAARPANDEEPTDANPSPLLGALDRFAQFFIEPLFRFSTLDRELRAVDSENKKNLQDDTWRLRQLDKSLSNPKHPYCHFPAGNFEVLKTIPESQGIDVRDKFIEFHAQHYSANRMKLTILGRESLDVLEKWVIELFSPIVNKDLQQNRWEDQPAIRDEDLGMQIFAKPVMDLRKLSLCFPFIDEELLYESQPSRYLSHLIGHEGTGSIIAYIKSKGWANWLSASTYAICPGSSSLFEVVIGLTEDGLKHYAAIVNIFFQYTSLLRDTPPQKWIFEELKNMADVNFKFRQRLHASRFTSHTSSVMQKPLPRKWLLSGYRPRSFDPGAILTGLNQLRPDNFRMTVISQTFPGGWDKKEKWYGTEYRDEKIPDDLMAELKSAATISKEKRLPGLHLPHRNAFVPDKLEVERKEVTDPAIAPRLIRNDGCARTWWKKDDTFWVPGANVRVSLKSPLIFASVGNYVKARLLTELVSDALKEYSHDANLAGLQCTVSVDSRGLLLYIRGYNDKLPVLLEHVTKTMRDLEIKEDRFVIVNDRLTRELKNRLLLSPYQIVGSYMHWLNSEQGFVVDELLPELPNITAQDVRQFQAQTLDQVHMEIYVHGNMYESDALKITDMMESILKAHPLPQSQWPIIRSLILPPGANYVYRKTLENPENVNHAIETWFCVGDRSDRVLRSKTLLLDQMMHEPCFDQLRTKEQLGYVVFSGIRSFSTTMGIRFLLQGEKSPEYLDTRVEFFIAKFGVILDDMSESDFEGHKRSLIVKRLEKLKNLDQENSRHWNQITNEYYDFEQAQQDAAYIKDLTKAEMVAYYKKYFNPSSPDRARLSVHLHARKSGEVDRKLVELLQNSGFNEVPTKQRQSLDLLEKYIKSSGQASEAQVNDIMSATKQLGLKQMADEDEGDAVRVGAKIVESATLIKDVRRYKASLQVSSGPQPVKNLTAFEEVDPKL